MMTSNVRTFLSLSLSCLALSSWAGETDPRTQLDQAAKSGTLACAMFEGGVCAQDNSVVSGINEASPVAETPSGDGIPKITGNLSIKEPPSPKEKSLSAEKPKEKGSLLTVDNVAFALLSVVGLYFVFVWEIPWLISNAGPIAAWTVGLLGLSALANSGRRGY